MVDSTTANGGVRWQDGGIHHRHFSFRLRLLELFEGSHDPFHSRSGRRFWLGLMCQKVHARTFPPGPCLPVQPPRTSTRSLGCLHVEMRLCSLGDEAQLLQFIERGRDSVMITQSQPGFRIFDTEENSPVVRAVVEHAEFYEQATRLQGQAAVGAAVQNQMREPDKAIGVTASRNIGLPSP